MSSSKNEKIGSIFSLTHAVVWGIYAVLLNKYTQNVPPISFAAWCTLFASISAFIQLISQNKLGELKQRSAYKSLILVTFCIVVFPYTLLFMGTKLTSGLNTSILLLAEIIFTVIFTHFIGEKTTLPKILGSFTIFFGAILILYKGTLQLNLGDILIILSTLTYPIGNYYSKKALNHVSSSTIIFTRYLFGSLFIFTFAHLFEPQTNQFELIQNNFLLIFIIGSLILGCGKILWYQSLKRLDITKAFLLTMTFPLFSLLFLVITASEQITIQQTIGTFIMLLGVYINFKRPSVAAHLTRYGKKSEE